MSQSSELIETSSSPSPTTIAFASPEIESNAISPTFVIFLSEIDTAAVGLSVMASPPSPMTTAPPGVKVNAPVVVKVVDAPSKAISVSAI